MTAQVLADNPQGPKSDKPLEQHLETPVRWDTMQTRDFLPCVCSRVHLSIMSSSSHFFFTVMPIFICNGWFINKTQAIFCIYDNLKVPYSCCFSRHLSGMVFELCLFSLSLFIACQAWKLVCCPTLNLFLHRPWFQQRRFNKYLNGRFGCGAEERRAVLPEPHPLPALGHRLKRGEGVSHHLHPPALW